MSRANSLHRSERIHTALRRATGVTLVALIWEIAPRLHWINPSNLPPFSAVLFAFLEILTNGRLFQHLGASLSRSGIGFVVAAAMGIPLGILLGRVPRAARIGDPILQLFRNTPALAIYPVFILLFGLGEFSKYAIITYGTLWPILLNTVEGVKSADPSCLKVARSLGVGPVAILRKVVLPGAFPSVATGLRLGATRAILLLVAAEMLGAKQGLGFLVFDAEFKYEIPTMYAAILVLILLGVLANHYLVRFEHRVTRWKAGSQGVGSAQPTTT